MPQENHQRTPETVADHYSLVCIHYSSPSKPTKLKTYNRNTTYN